MIPSLLKFLGVRIEGAQQVSSVSLQLRQAGWLGWVVFVALLLGGFTWWAYRYLGGHRELAMGRRKLLTSLRIVLFLLLLFILLRPVFSFTVENRLRRKLVVLVDKSASMDIQDPRVEDADIKRAGIAKGMIDRLDQALDPQSAAAVQHCSRTELIAAAFENKRLALLDRLKRDYDIEYYDFDRSVFPASEDQALKETPPDDDGARQATAIGDAVRDVTNRERGQPAAGILLVSDGGNNSGSEPLEAAEAAGLEKMPLYIYGVGITSPRDIIVDQVFAPDVAFIKDNVPVTVRLRGQGLKGETAHLTLKLGDEEMASADVEFTGEEQTVPMTFTPETAGEFDLTASIPARDDETVKDNNSASQRIRVIDSKIKVLYIEQAPRWEFRFLESVLMRDRRIDAKFVLLEGDPGLSQAEGSPYLGAVPATKEDLFKYDLLIIGDVDPKTFTPAQMDAVTEFVSKFGGAVAFIAGQQYDPAAYAGTPLEKLLPVELGTSTAVMQEGAGEPTTLAPTAMGLSSPMLKLSPDEAENAEIWKNFPPIQWINRVARAKPGAQVLLEDTDPAKMTRFGRMPALALQQYGVGQSLYMGTDDTWRWRQDSGVAYYPIFWGQVVQRLALAHLLGGSKRTQLSVDKQQYNTGDRVTVYARLYDESFEPVKQESATGSYSVEATAGQAETPAQTVQLRALPDQPGMYRGDFVALTPGTYKFSVESDTKTALEFPVTKSRFELGETAMNEPLLKAMAQTSGGEFFREEDLATLPDKLSQKDEHISRVVDADIWSSPFYFLLVTGLVVTEWVARKRSDLK
jgi:hypothetical protein